MVMISDKIKRTQEQEFETLKALLKELTEQIENGHLMSWEASADGLIDALNGGHREIMIKAKWPLL